MLDQLLPIFAQQRRELLRSRLDLINELTSVAQLDRRVRIRAGMCV